MNMPLRIVQVVNVRWHNATAWYGLSLASLLAGAGHEVMVLTLPGSPPEARARELGLRTLSVPLNSAAPLSFARTLGSLHRLLRDFKPQIVNCHRGEGLFLWGLLKSAPFVSSAPFALIRTRGDQRPPKGNAANRWLHRGPVDAVIATNSRTLAQCQDILGVERRRLYLIPGGVDRRRFAPDPEARERVRRSLGIAADEIVVGLLGRFDPVKGQHEFLQAMQRLKALPGVGGETAPRIRPLLAGFAANISRETMQGWVRDCGLEGQALITGKVEDVAGHINAMDIGVVASRGSEAIARAAFEIMACGVPLLGTDVGVMPDLLGKDALVPAGDTESLAELIGRAVGDRTFRARLREAQQARMSAFSQQAFLEQSLAVYSRVLEGRVWGRFT